MVFDKHFIMQALPEALILYDNIPAEISFSIDSRSLKAGDIFVALKGAKCDGHTFLNDIFKKGASGCIIDASKKESINHIASLDTKLVILVNDVLDSFMKLAIAWRQQFSCPIVAITGSVGKTSTKECLSRIMLKAQRKYFVSHENQNTKLGVAINILRMKAEHQLGIFEIGISRRGEMAEIVNILRPTTAIITNIGHQHMDGLGSLNDIALEKRAVFTYFTEDSIGIINGDQAILSNVAYAHPVVKFGTKTTNQVQVRKMRSGSDITFVLKIYKKKYQITLENPHTGSVFNAIAAAAVAHWLKVSDDIIVEAIQERCVIEGRFEERAMNNGTGFLINDCYNANPESMKAALLAFQQIETATPKIAILGDMLGLGVNSPFWHRQVGRFLRKVPSLQKVVLVGNLVSWIKKTAPVGLKVELVSTWNEAIDKITPDLSAQPAILIKGSRAVGLDNIVEKLASKNRVQSSFTNE